MVLLLWLQIKSGFNEGLDDALNKYPDKGFKDVWNNMQTNVSQTLTFSPFHKILRKSIFIIQNKINGYKIAVHF